MEFVDDDARRRFLFKSRPTSCSSPHQEDLKFSKIHAAGCISAAAALLATAVSFSHTSILFTLLIWASLSLLLAPFAPSSSTGGDPRVGRGDPLPSPIHSPAEPEDHRRRPVSRRNHKPAPPFPAVASPEVSKISEEKRVGDLVINTGKSLKEAANHREDWTLEDLDILKRQISKHPNGMPGRWERISEAFNGRHGVESVIRAAKSLAERKPSGGDSFAEFLKQRKPLDKRVDAAVNGDSAEVRNGGGEWSSGEDIALLNALKAFPKDASMRWEKVAAAVPGKSKAECMRRVSELKRDFRSSKDSEK